MKIPFTLSLGVIILMTSCSTNQDVASNKLIQKRKYTKGFHVNLPSAKVNTDENEKRVAVDDALEVNHIEDKRTAPNSDVYYDQSFMASTNSPETFAERSVKTPETAVTTNPSVNEELAAPVTMTKEEKKAFKKEFKKHARKSLRDYKASSPVMAPDGSLVLYVILGIFIPPLAVGLLYGIGTEFWISLVLTLIFWIPGIIYALIKVFQQY